MFSLVSSPSRSNGGPARLGGIICVALATGGFGLRGAGDRLLSGYSLTLLSRSTNAADASCLAPYVLEDSKVLTWCE